MTGSGVEYRTNPRFMPDNVSIKFGTGGDSRIYYDGTDLVMSPAEVGTGDLKIGGASLLLDSGEKIDFGAGDVTLTHAANKLTLGGGDFHVANDNGLVIGHTAQATVGGVASELQVLGLAGADASAVIGRWGNNGSGPILQFLKSRDPVIADGSFAIVQDGDAIGQVSFLADDGTDYVSLAAGIRAEIDGTPGANNTPGRILLLTAANGANTPTERMRIDSAGGVFIGETANVNMTAGLTINQGANDDQILALKSSDVAHGLTSLGETDTYGFFSKTEGGSGGLGIDGLKDADGLAGFALLLRGTLGEAADTTDTTSSIAVVHIDFAKKSVTTNQAIGATENGLVIANKGTVRLLVKGDGALHATNITAGSGDLDGVALDAYDDVGLVRLFSRQRVQDMGIAMSKWDEAIQANAEDLKTLGVLSSQGDFYNMQRMNDLLGGAIWQLATRVFDMEQRLLPEGT